MAEPGAPSVNGYFARPLTEADIARMGGAAVNGGLLSLSAMDSLAGAIRDGDMGGDTLDDIVMQNQQEMERRRSMHPSYARAPPPRHDPNDLRRAALMDYEPAAPRPGDAYAFSSAMLGGNGAMMPVAYASNALSAGPTTDPSQRHPAASLALDTRFASAVTSYPGLHHHQPHHPHHPHHPHQSPYTPAMHSAPALDLDPSQAYESSTLSAQLAHSMSAAFSASAMDHASRGDPSSVIKAFNTTALQRVLPDPCYDSTRTPFSSYMQDSRDSGGAAVGMGGKGGGGSSNAGLGTDPSIVVGAATDANGIDAPGQDDAMDTLRHLGTSEGTNGMTDINGSNGMALDLDEVMFMTDRPSPTQAQPPPLSQPPPPPQQPQSTQHSQVTFEAAAEVNQENLQPPRMQNREESMVTGPSRPDEQGLNENGTSDAEHPSRFRGVYSASGFDMLKILMRVATRPDPEINIGAVDMSCAFVVCDISQHDIPIVYCSEVFERLTGYTRHEILGRNCRFLQAPDGKVRSGLKRQYVDDQVVFRLKKKITARREVQTSLINYRKGGQPFMNLLTMIPISWDTPEIRFYVGFQVDLVETPQSVTNKNPDGTYSINYQRGYLPRYVWHSPENNRGQIESGQTIPRDDVSTVLSTIGTGESELSKRIWDKMLLENTDDVVHVLSLKGLFLYLSPSSRKVLGYDSSELVGTALSSVCHPSDIVPVTRELKDTSAGAPVNVVFRIRRKHTGYTWFESHGSLHTEQGKGRKCIILVGRERPVYALSRNDINAAGGIGENELWTKMSTSGMFLFVPSSSKTLLDRPPEELVGTSIQALMRRESKLEFGRQLELARTGKQARLKHEMQNRRGQVLQAHTTLYPGDASEGQKPTFLVAQTRLLKISRPLPGVGGDAGGKNTSPNGSTPTVSTGQSGASPSRPGVARTNSSQQSPSSQPPETVTTQPGGAGLPIGTQDDALAADENVFDELKTTRSTSWQFELRQMEKRNRLLAEELQSLLSARKKRKRRRGAGQVHKDCANCHTRTTPEWRRGPSGNRDLCNSCGLRWAKQNGRVSPRTGSQHSDNKSASPAHSSPPLGQTPNNGQASVLIPGAAPTSNAAPAAVGSMPPPDSKPLKDGNIRAGGGGGAQRDANAAIAAGAAATPSTSTPSTTSISQQQPRLPLTVDEEVGIT